MSEEDHKGSNTWLYQRSWHLVSASSQEKMEKCKKQSK